MKIAEFLLALATDRELLARFIKDPETVLDELRIDDGQRALLLSGKLGELRINIDAELEVSGERVAFRTVHTVTVHIAPSPES